MKITGLRCAVIGKHPIVRIVTDEGLYGFGEVEFTKSYLKPLVLHFREALIGEDSTDVGVQALKEIKKGADRGIDGQMYLMNGPVAGVEF